jgi:hypothetical protein
MYNWHVVWFMAKTYGYKSPQHRREITFAVWPWFDCPVIAEEHDEDDEFDQPTHDRPLSCKQKGH